MSDITEKKEIYKFPVSPTQSAFWVMNQLAPDNAAYNIPLVVEIKGNLNFDVLQQAVNSLLMRYEILRTGYAEENGELYQYIHPMEALCLYRQSFISEGIDAKYKINQFLVEQAGKRFDLTSGHVIRSGLLEQGVEHYTFYLFIHHIAVDHAAIHQLSKEMSVIYNTLSESLALDMAEPDLQYVDYVMWHKEQAESDIDRNGIALWKKNLEGFSGILDLPGNGSRPPFPSGCGATHSFLLDKNLSSLVTQFCRQHASSPYQVLLSALKVLLARYSNQKDIIVGTPFSGRQDQEELQNVMGCFINTLPIATQLDSTTSFSDLLQKVKKGMLFAFENQTIPFDQITHACIKNRDLSYNPLFQVGFVFQEPPASFSLNNLQCSNVAFDNGAAMYDMHLWMWEADNHLHGDLTFSTDVFSIDDIDQLLSSFKVLIASLIKNPDASVFSVNFLSHQDTDLLKKINNTQTDWPASDIPSLISAKASQQGEATAACFSNDVSLSYNSLESRSNQLANVLVEQGVKPGDFIGLCTERNEYMLISLLAILKVGAAYVPLDPVYPEERLAFMVETASINLLLMTATVSQILPSFTGEKMCVDSDWDNISEASGMFESLADPDGLAYVIFTSGSTGKPKGVKVAHRTVSNFLLSMTNKPGFKTDDRLLAITTLSFDIAVLELYLPLISGALLIVANQEQSSDGSQLHQLILKHNVNVMQATPSTWRGLLAAGFKGGEKFKVLCGGEAFPKDLAKSLTACCGEVWNMYGPTETTVWSSCYQLPAVGAPVLIGKPIANTWFYILDDNLQPTAIGVPGELYIGGLGVASGYLNREDLTAERFLINPFDKGIMYRTGDLVKLRKDGELEYCNRIDNQVKVRGFRIELGEIESVLNKHPQVVEAVASVKQYSAIDQRIIAYAVFKDGEAITNTDMRRFLRGYLPDYMIPQFLVEMDSLPLMPNGKVDRSSLPDQLMAGDGRSDMNENQSPLQIQVAEIWSQHLGVEKIQLTDTFLDLGGHSLLATMAALQIESEFSVSVSPMIVFTNTLEQLAALLEKNIQVSFRDTQLLTSSEKPKNEEEKKPVSRWRGLLNKMITKG